MHNIIFKEWYFSDSNRPPFTKSNKVWQIADIGFAIVDRKKNNADIGEKY